MQTATHRRPEASRSEQAPADHSTAPPPGRRPSYVLPEIGARPARLILAALCVFALIRSLVWVVAVPIFEAPDEPVHFEYAAGILAAGRLLTGRDIISQLAPPTWAGFPDPAYLEAQSGVGVIVQRPGTRLPPDYGSSAWYAALDRQAHVAEPAARLFTPALLRFYPFGYYALVAAAMGLAAQFTSSAHFLFWVARSVSAVLVIPVVVTAYCIVRELGRTRSLALAIAGAVAAAPTTALVSSSVQPDALSAAAAGGALYTALVLRRVRRGWGWAAALGLSLAVLLVTKQHYFVFTAAAVAALLATRWTPVRSLPGAAAVLIPMVLVGAAQAWVSFGTPPLIGVDQFANVGGYHEAVQQGPVALAGYFVQTIAAAAREALIGQVHYTFWGTEGWMDAAPIFGSLGVTIAVWVVLGAATAVLGLLLVLRLVLNAARLVRIGRRDGVAKALRLASANPALNAYLLFTMFMLLIQQQWEQGRYWYPFLAPVFLVAVDECVHVLPRVRWRLAASRVVLAGLALFSIAFNVVALPSIHERYYGAGREVAAVDVSSLPVRARAADTGVTAVDEPYRVLSAWTTYSHTMAIAGWAVDPETRLPARAVFITIDGHKTLQAVTGDESPDLAMAVPSGQLGHAAFDLVFNADDLGSGPHRFTITAVSSDGTARYAASEPYPLTVP